LALELSTQRALPSLWPAGDRIDWPVGGPVDESDFLAFSGGKELVAADQGIVVSPWKPAAELAASRAVGSMIELPVLCGKHVVYYPACLVGEATHARFYTFMTTCDCEKAYLIQTEADGAHCKAANTPA